MNEIIDTVLLDYDGTLMDTNDLIRHSWNYLFQKVEGRIPTEEEIYSTYGEMMEVTLKRFFGGTEEEIRRYIDIYRTYHMLHNNEEICLFPGIADMLRQLKKKKYVLCLVTSRTEESCFNGLRQFGIIDCFDDFVTAEDTTAHKPNPDPVLAALKKLGKKPEQAIMLGDSWFDMECAIRAKVRPVLAGWSKAYWYRRERTSGKPEYIIRKPADLIDLLLKINRENRI